MRASAAHRSPVSLLFPYIATTACYVCFSSYGPCHWHCVRIAKLRQVMSAGLSCIGFIWEGCCSRAWSVRVPVRQNGAVRSVDCRHECKTRPISEQPCQVLAVAQSAGYIARHSLLVPPRLFPISLVLRCDCARALSVWVPARINHAVQCKG